MTKTVHNQKITKQNRQAHLIRFIIIGVLMISSSCAFGQHPAKKGRRLRTIAEDRYPEGNLFIGSASHHHLLKTKTAGILAEEFSYVTPANKFKQSYIHPDPHTWRWEDCDYWVHFAARNKQVMRLHAPIAPQCSKWVKDDARKGKELKQMLEEYVTAICKRYNDTNHIKWLDVVNETVNPDGTWFGPKEGTDSWENPWPKIGFDDDPNQTPLYIKYAFEIADSLAPDLKLIINQHGSMQPAMWEKVKQTVLYLRKMGLRVDGIGWQAHVDAGWEKIDNNIEKLKSLIEWAHLHDLEFHVTENNAYLYKWEWDDPENKEANYQKQGETFAAIIRTLLPYRKTGVVSWNLWHIQDDQAQAYKWGKNGCLWTKEGEPKSGYYQVQRVLELGTDSLRYHFELDVIDAESKENLTGYQLLFNDSTLKPEDTGRTSVTGLLAGNYPLKVSKKHYKTNAGEWYVHSDTAITVELFKKQYKVELNVNETNEHSVVSGVDITHLKDTFRTNYLGNVAIYMPVGRYQLELSKQGFKNISTQIEIQSDTVIFLEMQQTHADVKFRLTNGKTPINNATIVLQTDSAVTNNLGMATFRLLSIGKQYTYSITRKENEHIQEEFYLANDTTIEIDLGVISNILKRNNSGTVEIYPNPSSNHVNVKADEIIRSVIVRDIRGNIHKQETINKSYGIVRISDLPPAPYILEVTGKTGKSIFRLIIE
jgi:GH35 family endo-1,4-beta-xylanase